MRKIKKKAQQEIVGFVLIVILVVVALMVLIVIQIKKPAIQVPSKEATDLLSGLMGMTTDCIVNAPYKDTMMDLVGHCYTQASCDNLAMSACDYLNQTSLSALNAVLSLDSTVTQIELSGTFKSDSGDIQPIFSAKSGVCNNTGASLNGESTPVPLQDNSGNLLVSLNVCQ